MNLDSYYAIGDGHVTCQDYALHDSGSRYDFVIGADGCSGSKHSDVGARFIVHGLKNFLMNDDDIPSDVLEQLVDSIVDFEIYNGMSSHAFDATLLAAIYDREESTVRVIMEGDGLILFTRHDGTSFYLRKEYKGGAPFYLNYKRDGQEKVYFERFGDTLVKSAKNIGEPLPGSLLINCEPKFSLNSDVTTFGSHLYKSISIFSDGIFTYLDDKNVGAKVEDILPELVNYKNPIGEFVTRRMMKFNKDWSKKGGHRYDDIFCGTIIL